MPELYMEIEFVGVGVTRTHLCPKLAILATSQKKDLLPHYGNAMLLCGLTWKNI